MLLARIQQPASMLLSIVAAFPARPRGSIMCGITCIRPTAPFGLRTQGRALLSTSNTATTAAFLPVLAALALGIGQNPLLLTIPAVLGASCAFMLPVATPPNAIVYGSGRVPIPQMSKAGILLNLLFLVLITALAYTLLLVVFDVQIDVIPEWAGS